MNNMLKNVGLGVSGGLVIGPLIGLLLIKTSKVAYLEIDFAFYSLIAGLILGVIFCGVLFSFLNLNDKLTRIKPGIIFGIIIIGSIFNIAETVIILRKIIP